MKKSIFRKTDLSWIVDYDYDRSSCTCKAEEYIICPNCGHEITLRTWIEEF